jgi:hypothetical protein
LSRSVNQTLAKSAATDNHPITRPPLLTLIDAPLSSRLSRHNQAKFAIQHRGTRRELSEGLH